MNAHVVWIAAVLTVIGCASTRRQQVQPTSAVGDAAASAETAALELAVEPGLRGDEMGAALSRQARSAGVTTPAALVWGDLDEIPDGSQRVHVRSGKAKLDAWLVPNAHRVDMGRLARGVNDVLFIHCGRRDLWAARATGDERVRLDFNRAANDNAHVASHDLFALVNSDPRDISDRATSENLVALLDRLPTRARYAVMGLPD